MWTTGILALRSEGFGALFLPREAWSVVLVAGLPLNWGNTICARYRVEDGGDRSIASRLITWLLEEHEILVFETPPEFPSKWRWTTKHEGAARRKAKITKAAKASKDTSAARAGLLTRNSFAQDGQRKDFYFFPLWHSRLSQIYKVWQHLWQTLFAHSAAIEPCCRSDGDFLPHASNQWKLEPTSWNSFLQLKIIKRFLNGESLRFLCMVRYKRVVFTVKPRFCHPRFPQ